VTQEDGNVHARVEACVAEYSALNERATYMDLLANGVWAMVFVLLGFMARFWTTWHGTPGLVWTEVVVIEAMFITIMGFMIDHYLIVVYIQSELKSRIAQDLGGLDFWKWHAFLAWRRRRGFLMWEFGHAGTALGMIVAATVLRHHYWAQTDCLGLVISSAGLFALFRLGQKMRTLRGEWTKAANALDPTGP